MTKENFLFVMRQVIGVDKQTQSKSISNLPNYVHQMEQFIGGLGARIFQLLRFMFIREVAPKFINNSTN